MSQEATARIKALEEKVKELERLIQELKNQPERRPTITLKK